MGQEKVNWGILSSAAIAQEQMIPAMLKANNANLLAIASTSGKEIEVAKRFHIPKTYSNYEELLKDPEIDAIYIPLPNGLHSYWTQEAAKHGKHVLCEKPAALTEQEAVETIDVCDDNNVQFMEALMYQFHPQHNRVKEIIAKGEIGDLKLVKANFSFMLEQVDGNIRMDRKLGGGSLYDIGCYCIHSIRNVTDAEPIRVSAMSKKHSKYDVDMSVIGMMVLDNGIHAYFDCAMDMPDRHLYEIVGTKGTIEVSKAFITQVDGQGDINIRDLEGQKREEIIYGDSYTIGMEHYSNCILNNIIPTYSKQETIKNMRAIEAFIETIDTGNVVKIQSQ